MKNMMFKNRIDGGEQLAKLLKKYQGEDAVIFALPRGGVVTGKVISRELNLPMGLLIVRKIGAPFNPEYAIAAVSESGLVTKNQDEVDNVNPDWFKTAVADQMYEINRRRRVYWGNRKPIEIENKIVIIVDDGIATGLSIMAAINEIKKKKPKKIVVAVPVAPQETALKMEKEVGEFISVYIPDYYEGAVGDYYEDFGQVEDKDVVKILNNQE